LPETFNTKKIYRCIEHESIHVLLIDKIKLSVKILSPRECRGWDEGR